MFNILVSKSFLNTLCGQNEGSFVKRQYYIEYLAYFLFHLFSKDTADSLSFHFAGINICVKKEALYYTHHYSWAGGQYGVAISIFDPEFCHLLTPPSIAC